MKKFSVSILALTTGLALALPAIAVDKQAAFRQNGESALEMANRVDACKGAAITTARFTDDDTVLRVKCAAGVAGATGAAGMAGGLGGGAGIAVGVLALGVAAAAGGGSSTSSTN